MMRFPAIPSALAVVASLAAPQATLAQAAMPPMDMSAHHHHAGMAMPAPAPAPAPVPAPDPDTPQGTDQAPGSAEPPAVDHDRPADRFWNPVAMARAERAMMDAHSSPRFSAMKIDLAEYRFGLGQFSGGDSYRWEGEGWVGDVNRLLLRTRGEGAVRGRLDQAELEVAYSRALDPWWNLQAGLRQDVGPAPARTHAMLAIEGLAPYRFDVLAAAYLSDKGQATARLETAFDQRMTRRIVVQPRAELNLSAQDMPEERLGTGLTGAELGLRIRYEISRKFAPYIGLSWEWASGRTATYRRADGESTASRSIVMGIKSWF